jgi:Ca2+-binding RTX toxin-like protein
MAIYDLSYSTLESLLDRSFSPGTENAIIEAIKIFGIINSGSGKIGVDVVDTGGPQTVPSGVQILLDTGASNNINVTTQGATLIAAGDGSVGVVDQGPGGDTLIGGAGAESLTVTQGENLLIAGSGENTLVGGAGHDTLIGGGSSFLQAGSGGSTLIGGLPQLSGSSDTLMGGPGDDLLRVSGGDNLLVAGTGHDTIIGGYGADTIIGGGNDTINVDHGNELVQGGAGSDVVNVGLHGNDTIYGGHATTVDTDQNSKSIESEVTVNGVTTIQFSNHQVLTVSNVTIDFADGHKPPVH